MNRILQAMSQHPIGFWFIFWGEAAERAAYYGVMSSLATYGPDIMGMSQGDGALTVHIFKAACYFAPLLGGLIADRFLGRFWTIIIFAVPYLMGYPILSLFQTQAGLFCALALLAFGSGTIKPNLSPMMGAMYEHEGKPTELISSAFTWFYAAINIGAAVTSIIVPIVLHHYGYKWAFMVPAVMMAAALILFWLGKKHYPPNETRFGPAKQQTTVMVSSTADDRRTLINVGKIFAVIIFFWAVYEQTASTWIYFIQDHAILHGMQPQQLAAINPILIVALSPLFNLMWGWLRIKSPITKMKIGFGLTVACMAVLAVAGWLVTPTVKIDVAWVVGATVIITFAELCISIVGLEFAFSEAPLHMRSRVTAAFLLTVFFGNLIAGVMGEIYPKVHHGLYFTGLTLMMALIAVVFLIVAKWYHHRKQQSLATATT